MPGDLPHWNDRYAKGQVPWDTGHPSTELVRVVAEEHIQPCRAIDLGCGTGINAVWLAQQGFEAVGVDLSPLAIERARERAVSAGLSVHFQAVDLLDPPDLGAPFRFFFDRGCWHVVRRIDGTRYIQTVEKLTEPGSLGLVLAGNAREKMDPGPPVVTEEEFRTEWGRSFEVDWLRPFRFDPSPQVPGEPLAWAGLLRRKPAGSE